MKEDRGHVITVVPAQPGYKIIGFAEVEGDVVTLGLYDIVAWSVCTVKPGAERPGEDPGQPLWVIGISVDGDVTTRYPFIQPDGRVVHQNHCSWDNLEKFKDEMRARHKAGEELLK